MPTILRRIEPPPPMVELVGVTKRWGAFTAVDDVSLAIRPGEFLTLLGPSGCGKTTLLRMIGGFERPTAGRVRLDGHDVTDEPPYRREVNQVFQSYALFPHLSVRENVAFGLRVRKVRREELRRRTDEAIALVGLDDLGHRRPAQLSGGQRQRVALARAVVNRPKVLLLDEPLSALDAALRHAMQAELKRLQSRLGITFVFVTHDQEEALTMSDRIAVVSRGRVEQIGPTLDVYHRPATSFVANFLGKANVLDATPRGPGRFAVGGMDWTVADGAPATKLAVRAERIAVTRVRPSDGNAFEATIVDALFRGAIDELNVRTDAGLTLRVVTGGDGPRHAAGERVWCRILAGDLVPLSA